jgi:hypothetical protein
MDQITSLAKFRNPYGNQEIELQEIRYEWRHTHATLAHQGTRRALHIFDIDPVTTKFWAEEMLKWAHHCAMPPENSED